MEIRLTSFVGEWLYLLYTIPFYLASTNQTVTVSWMSKQAQECGIKATAELAAWQKNYEENSPKHLWGI